MGLGFGIGDEEVIDWGRIGGGIWGGLLDSVLGLQQWGRTTSCSFVVSG